MTNSEHERKLHDINRAGADSVREAATKQRSELIELVFSALVVYAQSQQEALADFEAKDKLGKKPFEMTVLLTLAHLPFDVDDKPRPALSISFAPDINIGQVQKGEEKIMAYIPVDKSVLLDSSFDPSTLERPDFIVVERYDKNGNVRSYVISDNSVEEFESAVHEGEQITGQEFEDLHIMFRAAHRVRHADAVVGPLITDMTNWSAQVQRIVPENE